MGCEAVRTFSSLAGKYPKMAEKQTHRQVPHQLAKSSPQPLDKAGASKEKGQRVRKSPLYSWYLTKVITVTAVRSYLNGRVGLGCL